MNGLHRSLLAALVVELLGCGQGAMEMDGSSSMSGPTSGPTSGETGSGPPSAPSSPAPADGAVDVPLDQEFCWSVSTDPDGDVVAYRIWLDELAVAEQSTTCLDFPALVPGRSYQWRVEAFELGPGEMSTSSETWSFSTRPDGELVWFDDLEGESGWTVDGDAQTGAWVQGPVTEAIHQIGPGVSMVAQPGACAGGLRCLFTGENPDGLADFDDVDGGMTRATSPSLDLAAFSRVTISYDRFLYRSAFKNSGTFFRLELLVPHRDEPGGYQVHVLDQFGEDEAATLGANIWTRVASEACGIEIADGARLRFSASDLGVGIFEAAVDNVRVEGYRVPGRCDGGEGALCDPKGDGCDEGALCCNTGAVDQGIFRCHTPAAALDPDAPPATPQDPPTGASGCPAADLTVDATALAPFLDTVFIEQNSCSLLEGCVDGLGTRTVLRFAVTTANIGARDLDLGPPSLHPDLFHFSDCHQHQHFDDFARYVLLDGEEEVAAGHKQAFCIHDWESWAWPWLEGEAVMGLDGRFDCNDQGLSRGWADTYAASLDCQWIDVTNVPAGSYTLEVEVNPTPAGQARPRLVERDYGNNRVAVPVTIP